VFSFQQTFQSFLTKKVISLKPKENSSCGAEEKETGHLVLARCSLEYRKKFCVSFLTNAAVFIDRSVGFIQQAKVNVNPVFLMGSAKQHNRKYCYHN